MRFVPALILILSLTSLGLGQTYSIQTVAGGGLPENIQGLSASLGSLARVAVDADRNVFLSLALYHVVLRLGADGVLTRVAGNGTAGYSGDGGPATSAQLKQPVGLAVDTTGNLYIADSQNRCVRKVSNGVITTVAGNGLTGYSGDGGPAISAQLSYPQDIAVDATGNIFISDSTNYRIRKVSGGVITTVAGNGTPGYSGDGGPATSAQLRLTAGVAVDGAGNLYFVDASNYCVRKVSNGVITTVVGTGSQGFSVDPRPAAGAQLSNPSGVAVDAAGNIYITERYSGGVSFGAVRKVSGGVITTEVGGPYDNIAPLVGPSSVALDAAGSVYISEGGSVLKVSNWVMTTLAGGGQTVGNSGPATSVQLSSPGSVAVDSGGSIYIADGNRIRKVSNGVVTTVAGNGTPGYSGDNGPATSAQLVAGSVAVDGAGNLFIVGDHRIRKVSNGVITTVAGTGSAGYSGDGGPAASAQLNYPGHIVVDGAGNLYFSDRLNYRVRKISNGVITTVAGNGTSGYSGDGGPASSAQMRNLDGVAVDTVGNLYIADSSDARVRKVSNGVITTVAGNGSSGYSGDGGPATSAQLSSPSGIAADGSGNLFIADSLNQRIRKVSGGVITTIAGTGRSGFSGESGPATSAKLYSPSGLAADLTGKLYIADSYNQRIRMLAPAVFTVSAASFASGVAVAPGAIVSGFGSALTTATEGATQQPLPTSLADVTVKVQDSLNVERLAPLFFVSPGQINYLIPQGTAAGRATVTVTSGGKSTATGTLQVEASSPGLFTQNFDGRGVASAVAVWFKPDGSQSWQYIFQCGSTLGSCVCRPMDLGPESDKMYLYLYGTGIRGRSSLTAVTATIGSVNATVEYAGEAPGFTGLDQVNVLVPRSLAGRGEVPLLLTVDGKPANAVAVSFR